MTDEELLLTGDFDTLFDRYCESLPNYVGAISRDPAAADDLAQAVRCFIVANSKAFTPDCLFRPWLFEVACNIATKHRRQRRRERAKFAEYVSTAEVEV